MIDSFSTLKDKGPCAPVLSVLVRVKNERSALPEFWTRISAQTIFEKLEVLFLDSGSTDGTLEFLESLPVSIYQIPPAEFSFGSSCNLLMSVSRASVACFLSGHVLLKDSDALENLCSVLSPRTYSAAYVRQVPDEVFGANSYERAYLAHRYPNFSGRGLIEMNSPGGFSNAASGLTRDAWERNPFPELQGSEDFAWAAKHLALGGKIFYLPEVKAMHSHRDSPAAVFERVRLNVRAKGIKGTYLKASYFFAGVAVAMLRQGAPISEALRYAKSHALAYAPDKLAVPDLLRPVQARGVDLHSRD
jgi:glycosyltransferase involved in cell wall biosynthesis